MMIIVVMILILIINNNKLYNKYIIDSNKNSNEII